MSTSYRKIEAVTKTLEILEYLARQKEPVNGPDIARAVNLPVGTAMCHLATLEDKNFIRRVGGYIELGMGAALIYISVKNCLENRIQKDQSALAQLETREM